MKTKEIPTGIKRLGLILTRKCNLKCRYCLRAEEKTANRTAFKELDYGIIKKAIPFFQKKGYQHIALTGGEPLLYSLLEDLINFLGRFKWRQILIETNGTLLSRKILDCLKSTFGKNLSLRISLDSHKESLHNYLRGNSTFKKTVEAIKLAKSKGLFVTTNAVITPFNFMNRKELKEFLEFNKRLEVDLVTLNRVVKLGRSKNNKKLSLTQAQMSQIKKILNESANYDNYLTAYRVFDQLDYCPRIGTAICLSPRGVHPCAFHEEIVLDKPENFDRIDYQTEREKLKKARASLLKNNTGAFFSCPECVKNLSPIFRHKLTN